MRPVDVNLPAYLWGDCLDLLALPVWVVSADDALVYVNPAAVQWLHPATVPGVVRAVVVGCDAATAPPLG